MSCAESSRNLWKGVYFGHRWLAGPLQQGDIMRMLRFLAAMTVALALIPAVASAVTIDDILYLSKAGVSESVILALIDRDKTVFTLAPDQLVSLKHDGVSDAVLLAMLKSGRDEGDAAARGDGEFNRALYLSDRAAMQAAAPVQVEAAPRPPEVVTVPVPVPVPYAVSGSRRHRQRGEQPTFAPAVAPPGPAITGVAPMSMALPAVTAPALCVAHVAPAGPSPPLLNAPGFLTVCPPGVR